MKKYFIKLLKGRAADYFNFNLKLQDGFSFWGREEKAEEINAR